MRLQEKEAAASGVAVTAGSFGKRISSGCGPVVALRVSEVLDDEIVLLEATSNPAEIVDLTEDMDLLLPLLLPPGQPPTHASVSKVGPSAKFQHDWPILWTNDSDDSASDSDANDSIGDVESLNGQEEDEEEEHRPPSPSPEPRTSSKQTGWQRNNHRASSPRDQIQAQEAVPALQVHSPPSSPLPSSSRLKRRRRAWEPPRQSAWRAPSPAAVVGEETITKELELLESKQQLTGSAPNEAEGEAKEEQQPQAAEAEAETSQSIGGSPAVDSSPPKGEAECPSHPNELGMLHLDGSYPVPWLNELTSSPPPPYRHLSGGCEVSGAVEALDDHDALFRGCDCAGPRGCTLQCPCRLRGAAGYDRAGRLTWTALEGLSLWECSERCGCDPRKCANRVVQRAGSVNRALPMHVFRHEEQGWGVRCSEPILQGAYVGEYLGVLLDESACAAPDTRDEYMFSVSTASIHPGDVAELRSLLLQAEEADSLGAAARHRRRQAGGEHHQMSADSNSARAEQRDGHDSNACG